MTNEAVYLKNKDVYNARKVTAFYAAQQDDLCPAERAILDRFGPELRGRSILDLGVGAGRTTNALHALASTYVGADHAKEMVATCRASFPGLDFRECDARRMEMFAEDSFDVVFFSGNAIDHVSHEDRLVILREIRRVLRGGGLLVFSSHNLRFARRSPFALPRFAPRPGLLARLTGTGRRLVDYATGIVNFFQNRRYEQRGNGWALLVDLAHQYSLVLYYTTITAQIAQLADLGFATVELRAREGGPLSPDASYDGPWVYYVARKVGGAEPS